MKTRLIASLFLAASLCAVNFGRAQTAGNNTVLNGVTLVQASTNSYTPGTTNGVYINTFEYDRIGLALSSTTVGGSAATGNIILRLAKTDDGNLPEASPTNSVTVAINSTNNNKVVTWLDCTGIKGYYATGLELSATNVVTNQVTLKVLYKYPKYGSVGPVDK